MSEELRPCPFCGGNDIVYEEALSVTYCNDCGGELDEGFGSDWNTRPIEDALNARIAELEAEIERLSQLLHDEMSQLEIATDLANKRWAALNKIYEERRKG